MDKILVLTKRANKLLDRAKELGLTKEQKHISDTPEKEYWHYGYAIAILDIYRNFKLVEIKASQLATEVKADNGGLDEQFLKGLNFIKCDKHYYRTKLYDDVYLEIDINDWFVSIVSVQSMVTWEKDRITKIVLPNKLTKERLIKLLEVIR